MALGRKTKNLRIGIAIVVLVAVMLLLWELRVYHLYSARP